MIKRFNPDFSVSISHELAYMRETPEGGYVAHGDYATLFSELESVKAERDALAQRAISIVEDAANQIAYAVFNLSDKSLDDLNPGLCDTTCPTDSALLAERRLRAFAAELREAK